MCVYYYVLLCVIMCYYVYYYVLLCVIMCIIMCYYVYYVYYYVYILCINVSSYRELWDSDGPLKIPPGSLQSLTPPLPQTPPISN
jgi:hypothetical protein